MANFNPAYAITMGHEGQWVNHPNDRGGETYKGIARRFHPNWTGWAHIDAMKSQKGFPGNLRSIQQKLEPHVQSFYKAQFWDRMRLDQVHSQQIANEMFDTAVNMGIAAAVADLQRSLNILNRNGKSYPQVAVDGKIGPITLSTLNRHPNPRNVFNTLNGFQFMRYVAICERDPSQEEFFNGWLNRVVMM
jgi:lysozyme family protein